MKATELMLGDLVLVLGELGKVIEIREHSVLLQGRNFYFGEEDIEPIPLTTEILEKNGFEKAHRPVFSDAFIITNRVYWCNYTLFAHEENDISGDNAYIMCKCEYVHELQHALKLCGIKKEIML